MKFIKNNSLSSVLSYLVDAHNEIEKLSPRVSSVEKVKLENSIAIDQLYYSSQLEGTHLTKEMIEAAIHGEDGSASKN
jgi:hypothetical protein